MTAKKRQFHKGIRLKPDADAVTETGEMRYDDTSDTVKVGDGTVEQTLVSEDQTQTLENKTIVAADNTITTAASGNLAATELDAALDELQLDIDTRALDSDLTDHENATVAHGTTGDVVGTSDTQTLTNKTIVAASNTITTAAVGNLAATELDAALAELQTDIDSRALDTDLTNHVADTTTHGTTGAIVGESDTQSLTNKTIVAASNTITTAASGNLTSTELDAALAELQTDVDSRALDLDLTNHMSDTTTHGTTGDIVGTSDAQVITNKDIDGGTATDANRITVPKTTRATLDALTRKEATIAYASDDEQIVFDNGTELIPVGSGTGGIVNFDEKGDMELAKAGDYTVSGLTASITEVGTEVARGSKALKAAASATAQTVAKTLTVPVGYRNDGSIKLTMKVRNNTDWTVKIKSGSTVLFSEVVNTADVYESVELVSSFPYGTTALTWELESSASDTAYIDDVVLNTDPFPTVSFMADPEEYSHHGILTGSSSNTKCAYFSTTNSSNSTISSYGTIDNNATDGWTFTATKRCSFSGTVATTDGGAGYDIGFAKNLSGAELDTAIGPNLVAAGVEKIFAAQIGSASAAINSTLNTTGHTNLEAGDVIHINFEASIFSSPAEARPRINFTLQDIDGAENLISAQDANENDYSARITGSTITSQSDDFIATATNSGTGIYDIVFNTDFFSVAPSIIVTAENGSARYGSYTSLTSSGVTVRMRNGGGSLANVDFTIQIQRQGTDYKNPTAFVVTPPLETCYIKDVKSNGVSGGTFTSGAWRTRDLNTLEGSVGFCTLSANQFTLNPGEYEIEATAVGYQCSLHKAKLYDITNAADELIGQSSSSPTSIGSGVSRVTGTLTITEATTYELRHRCNTTHATGFGVASSYGVDEVFAQVKITKIK